MLFHFFALVWTTQNLQTAGNNMFFGSDISDIVKRLDEDYLKTGVKSGFIT